MTPVNTFLFLALEDWFWQVLVVNMVPLGALQKGRFLVLVL